MEKQPGKAERVYSVNQERVDEACDELMATVLDLVSNDKLAEITGKAGACLQARRASEVGMSDSDAGVREWLLAPDGVLAAEIEASGEVSGYGTGAAEHRAAEARAICKAQLRRVADEMESDAFYNDWGGESAAAYRDMIVRLLREAAGVI